MAKRKDGFERKAQLLEAATKVFAEKGFRDTTTSDICDEAKSNVASVNYYFGSKEELYAEVWKTAHQKTLEKYPPDYGTDPDAIAQERLKAFIRSLLHKILDSGQLGSAGKILMMELTNPTEAIELVKRDSLEPIRKRMRGIMLELLGPDVPEQKIIFCVLSTINQCFGLGLRKGSMPPPLRAMKKKDLLEELVEHITIFSLAGIEAVKRESLKNNGV
jgi:AcrR family transcriptional regulator